MSVTITGRYLGKKSVELTHGPSKTTLLTDAPKDNLGEGMTFAPTDLVASAEGACMLTIMVNVAERDGYDLTGSHFSVDKVMSPNPPRRISLLKVVFHLPKSLSDDARVKLERAAMKCPVHHSLHPDVQQDISFNYDI